MVLPTREPDSTCPIAASSGTDRWQLAGTRWTADWYAESRAEGSENCRAPFALSSAEAGISTGGFRAALWGGGFGMGAASLGSLERGGDGECRMNLGDSRPDGGGHAHQEQEADGPDRAHNS